MNQYKICEPVVLKRGRYVVTDPCYVFPNEYWSGLCDFVFKDNSEGWIDWDGFKVWWGQTAFGDGGYGVFKSGVRVGGFDVDAGLFGIFPFELVMKLKPELLTQPNHSCVVELGGRELGYEVVFGEGVMSCGDIIVDTKNDGDEEDEEDEEEEEEEEVDESEDD